MFIHVCIIYGRFYTTVAELISSNRGLTAHKAPNVYLPLYKRGLLTAAVDAPGVEKNEALERIDRLKASQGREPQRETMKRPGEKERQKR